MVFILDGTNLKKYKVRYYHIDEKISKRKSNKSDIWQPVIKFFFFF